MNFSDRWATDEQGNRFVFTVEMQRRLHNAGLPLEPSALAQLGNSSPPATQSQERTTAAPEAPQPEMEEPATIQIDPRTGKYLGRLKWYNASRGYGFIARGGGEDIFFHKSGAVGDPEEMQEGQWVLYDVEQRKKGPEATEVEPYEEEVGAGPEEPGF